MMTGTSQHPRNRPRGLEKTTAMCLADRRTAQRLDEVWLNGDALYEPMISVVDDEAEEDSHTADDSLLRVDAPDRPRVSFSAAPPPSSSAAEGDGHRKQAVAEPLLRLNIGGTSFIMLLDTLIKTDMSSFLCRFAQLRHEKRILVADSYLTDTSEYYFQRTPLSFEPIFQFYATGVIHKPPEMCPEAFLAELKFWGLPPDHIGSCCAEELPVEKPVEKEDTTDYFEGQCCNKIRRKIWHFLDSPGSSNASKIFEVMSAFFVLASVMGLSIGTIPELQEAVYIPTDVHNASVRHENGTLLEGYERQMHEHRLFTVLEYVCIIFFTVEYALRLFAAPRKMRFIVKPLNVVDLMAILPFYIEQGLAMVGFDDRKLRDLRWAFLVVRILRVLRVIRIIKLGRFSSGLQTFAMTLKRSQKQLQMMTIVLLTGVVFFSTMIYFLEKDEPMTPFSSIPAAYWWCIVTMTTVGYGDAVPTTVVGKIVASAAIMCGVLVLALPITIIVDNFIKVAQDEAEQETQQLRAEPDK